MFDGLKITLFIGIVAVLVAMGCFLAVALANSGSRNIPLALGTVFGAMVLLTIQAFFELRSVQTKAVVGTEFTIDNQEHKILPYRYRPGGAMLRSTNELEANKFLRENNLSAFTSDNGKLWKDMQLFSFVAYLWTEQHDWQISRENIDSSQGGFSMFQYLSGSDDQNQCTKINLATIQAMLHRVENVFADFKLVGLPFDFMCLPPRSSLSVEKDKVTISNPYCTIDFMLAPAMQINSKPGMIEVVLMEDKRPRYETRTGVVRATISYDWVRAQNREMPKYKDWANDVVERARKWFEVGSLQEGIYFKDAID